MSQMEKMFCCFTLEGNQYLSELLLDAENTSLILHSRHQIPYNPEPHSLFGESLDHKKSAYSNVSAIRQIPKAPIQK